MKSAIAPDTALNRIKQMSTRPATVRPAHLDAPDYLSKSPPVPKQNHWPHAKSPILTGSTRSETATGSLKELLSIFEVVIFQVIGAATKTQ